MLDRSGSSEGTGLASVTDKLFVGPVTSTTTSCIVGVVVTVDVLPFIAGAAAHHGLTVILYGVNLKNNFGVYNECYLIDTTP